ncbi:hypothetical protein Micbo1qcDRAFT_208978 [Microdochium bolleyi]|uniref:Uncharacterized protein n=1 Tax=Microdochium bolleyi TaxID=196109 RepID=A0A136INR4_9PEZI|nr:hypothetical protein Micbo1qcDRAFT_208978 [Microdochium bolleyi]
MSDRHGGIRLCSYLDPTRLNTTGCDRRDVGVLFPYHPDIYNEASDVYGPGGLLGWYFAIASCTLTSALRHVRATTTDSVAYELFRAGWIFMGLAVVLGAVNLLDQVAGWLPVSGGARRAAVCWPSRETVRGLLLTVSATGVCSVLFLVLGHFSTGFSPLPDLGKPIAERGQLHALLIGTTTSIYWIFDAMRTEGRHWRGVRSPEDRPLRLSDRLSQWPAAKYD